MIDLYTWSTPNGKKASIMLEEVGLPYQLTAVDITKGEQHAPEFRAISPNGKIPAIVDRERVEGPGQRIFESGNILIYLAEKTGMLLPQKGEQRTEVLGWLFFQVGHLGPMVGQWHWFKHFAPVQSDLGIKRYQEESLRLLEVMSGRLGDVPYLGGTGYSIADVACYAWAQAATEELKSVEPKAVAAMTPLQDWLERVGSRPAVTRGMELPTDEQKQTCASRSSLGIKGPAGGATVLP